MRIEIWSDLICPWCGLGNHRLEQALAQFDHREQVEVVHRSFQLDESAPEGVTQEVPRMLAQKMGLAGAQIEAMTRRIEAMAHEDGLTPYNVFENRVGNTSLAHELAAFAAEHGKSAEMWQLLYATYFGEAKSIFDIEALVPLAERLGLDGQAARDALTTRRFADKVRADGREARALGSNGVPFVVIDRKYAVSGAQPVELLKQAIETAWRERAPQPLELAQSDAGVCGPDGCIVPERQ